MRKYNGGAWTEARFNSFIKSSLRTASVRWPARYQALNEAFVDKRINIATGRLSKHYKCAECAGLFPTSQVQVDHIDPVVPLEGFTTWDIVIDRMFCEKEGFQILCKTCHKTKTEQERIIRKEIGK